MLQTTDSTHFCECTVTENIFDKTTPYALDSIVLYCRIHDLVTVQHSLRNDSICMFDTNSISSNALACGWEWNTQKYYITKYHLSCSICIKMGAFRFKSSFINSMEEFWTNVPLLAIIYAAALMIEYSCSTSF